MSKRPWQTELVLMFVGLQLLCVVLGQMTILVLHKSGISGFKHEDDFGNILLATLSFQGVTWILIPIFLRLNQVRFSEIFGLNVVGFTRALGWGLVVVAAALALEYVYERVLQEIGWHPESETAVELLTNASLWPTGIYLVFFAVILAPIAEEFIFRGVLYPFIKSLGFPKMAWIGVSLLFGLIHGTGAFIPLALFALALTWLYEKTGNLLASVIAHALFNTSNLVVLVYQNR